MPLTDSLRDDILASVPNLRAFAISLSGNADRADRTVEAHRRKQLLDRLLGELAEQEADGEQDQGSDDQRDRIQDGVKHLGRRTGNRLDLERVQSRDRHRDHDQEEDDHSDRAADRGAAHCEAGSGAFRACRNGWLRGLSRSPPDLQWSPEGCSIRTCWR